MLPTIVGNCSHKIRGKRARVDAPDGGSADGNGHVEVNVKDGEAEGESGIGGNNGIDNKVVKRNRTYRRRGKLRFMDIPAELRNLIYEYCVEEPRCTFSTKTVYLTKRKPDQDAVHTVRRGRRKQWIRQFFALTQVCRQIRSEFRPIYMKDNQTWIRIKDSAEYIETFFPSVLSSSNSPSSSLISTGGFQGNFVVNVIEDYYTDWPQEHQVQAPKDITRLLEICMAREEPVFKFACIYRKIANEYGVSEVNPICVLLKDLFFKNRTAWMKHLNNAIHTVELYFARGRPERIHLYLNPGVLHWGSSVMFPPSQRPVGVPAFLEEFGLGQERQLSVVVVGDEEITLLRKPGVAYNPYALIWREGILASEVYTGQVTRF
ncbi:hypothetical protein K505DRAFT_362834 [Melanomma pulvis-pyrius CBS 109.77]|uniref:F-box domain-containing protein n=1 Tax=Melanomma pulvis-pyrius CBS 109.77 TaxID=1314802 RepID=A0A6A6X7M1_9PLEO|nr:hypothetical protein K505DRAFT_362834 [Melanomma pulvis-pyrius CBS 109.77]